MPLFSQSPSRAVKIALVLRCVPTFELMYPPFHTPWLWKPTLEYGPVPVLDRPDRVGMSPSMRLFPPVPVSAAGAVLAVATAPWIVNLIPPTELAVWEPLAVTPAWTVVPTWRNALARVGEALVET